MGTNTTSPPGYNTAAPRTGVSTRGTNGLGPMGTRPGTGGTGMGTTPMSTGRITGRGPTTNRTGTGMTGMRSTSTHLGATGSTGRLPMGTRVGPMGTLSGAANKTTRSVRSGAIGDVTMRSLSRTPADVRNLPGKAVRGTGNLLTQGGTTLKRAGRVSGLKPPTKSSDGKAGILGAFMGRRGTRTAAPRKAGKMTAMKKTGGLHVMGFVTNQSPTGGTTASSLKALSANSKAVSYLSPLWYSVKSDGTLVDKSSAAIMSFAKSHSIPIVPLVNNQNSNDTFLQSDSTRKAAVDAINAVIKKQGFAGVSIDFQGLQPKDRVPLNTFMDELSALTKPENKLLTIDVIPTQAQTGAHGAYDEHTLARFADQIILMTYDRHDNTSSPGPVSPSAWVEKAVKHTLQAGVPAKKIYLGVNAYGYDWNTATGSGTTVGANVAPKLGPVKYSAAAQEAHITYTKNGARHVVWFGNTRSLKNKLAIAKKYRLYGLAVWQVGDEQPSFWKTLAAQNGPAPRKLGTGTHFNAALKGDLAKGPKKAKAKTSAAGKTAKKGKKTAKSAAGKMKKGAKKGRKRIGLVGTAAHRRSTGGGGVKADRLM